MPLLFTMSLSISRILTSSAIAIFVGWRLSRYQASLKKRLLVIAAVSLAATWVVFFSTTWVEWENEFESWVSEGHPLRTNTPALLSFIYGIYFGTGIWLLCGPPLVFVSLASSFFFSF